MAEANLVGHHRVFRLAVEVSCPPPPSPILLVDIARDGVEYEVPAAWKIPPLMMLFACDRRLQVTVVGCKRDVK